jgi:hypothetical protein
MYMKICFELGKTAADILKMLVRVQGDAAVS